MHVLKLSGQVDENSFEKAMRLNLDQEPVLGSRLVENDGNPYWERREDLEHITISSLVEDSSPDQQIQTFINDATHGCRPFNDHKDFQRKKDGHHLF